MALEYPQVIYLDNTSDSISLESRDGVIQEKYTRLDTGRGSSGVVYVNEESTKCIKFILYPQGISDVDKERQTHICENEVRLQTISHGVGFAPAIHRNFRTEISINGAAYHVYIIVMDYLNPTEWENIIHNELTPKMMKDFVMNTGLYNDVDPYNHFYRNRSTGQIVMIDYGKVKECSLDRSEPLLYCFNQMLLRLHSERKPRCKYWDKCERRSDGRETTGELKGADHFKLFTHPEDFTPKNPRTQRASPYGGNRNKQTIRIRRHTRSSKRRRHTRRRR